MLASNASRRPAPTILISACATAILLASAAVLTFTVAPGYRALLPYFGVLCILGSAVAAVHLIVSRQATTARLVRRSPQVFGRVLAQLSPVILLSAAYPLAVARMRGVEIAGLPFSRLLLATSITAPWLGQIVCMPLFEALSPVASAGDDQRLRARALEAWPRALAAVVPVVIVMAVPVALTEGWRLPAITAFATLCLLNAVFAQSLVYSIVSRRSGLWLTGWACYAAALLIVPRAWFLPPVAGLYAQACYLGWTTRNVPLKVARSAGIMSELSKGALMGCVLWSDKYFYFLRFPDSFNALLLFGSMLPAIVAFNCYFAVHAPRTDQLVASVRSAMQSAPVARLRRECDSLSGHIRDSAAQAALLCALLTLIALSMLAVRFPADRLAGGAEMLACWCFVMGALLSYKIAYLGRAPLAYGYGAVHLLLVATVFALGPSGVAIYLTLAVVELVLTMVALQVCLRDWGRPEFMLFWRHAMRW